MYKKRKLTSMIIAGIMCFSAAEELSFAKDDASVTKLLYSEDYERYNAGDTIWNHGNYDISVVHDPDHNENLVAKQTFGEKQTEGFVFQKDIPAEDSLNGILVVEEKVKFSINSGGSFEHGIYMRTVVENNGFVLWNVTNTDLYGVKPENDRWYKITCAVDVNKALYTVYIQRDDGRLLGEADGLPLPGYPDYSRGIHMFFERYGGTSQTGDAVYTDDLRCYSSENELVAKRIEDEDAAAERAEIYYSEALSETLRDSVVLYIDQPYAYVNNMHTQIDEDIKVCPVIVADRTFLPLRFIGESLGCDVDWDASEGSVVLADGNKTVVLTIGSKKLISEGEAAELDAAPFIENDRTLVPARAVSEAFGKRVEWYPCGMVVIGARELTPDEQTELYSARYFTNVPELPCAEDHKLAADEAAEREDAFKQRNSEDELKELADDFFAMIDLERPELQKTAMFYRTGQYRRAFEEYRSFAFGALRQMDEDLWNWCFEYSGISSNVSKKGVKSNADLMLFDIVTAPNGTPLDLGGPGTINWGFNLPEAPGYPGGYSGLQNFMWNPGLYDPLFYSYYGTHRLSYLTKWTEYIDDWCINENSFSKLLPPQVPDSHNGNSIVPVFIYQLRLLSQILPENGDGMSEVTLVRALTKMVREYPVVTIEYMRSNPQNWTTGFFAMLISTGIQLEKLGFKTADYYIRAGLRRAEDFSVTQMCADGTETETTLGYLTEYIKYNPVVTSLIRKYKPELADDAWYIMQEEALEKTADLVIRLLVPGGTYAAGFRDTMIDRASQIEELLMSKAPQVLEKNQNKDILDAVRGISDGSGIPFTSVWYPNGGFYSIKDGWTTGSQSGFMYNAPYPYQRATGDNMFVLSAFGRDMLVAGEVGAYDPIRSPMLVDWKDQNAVADRTFWGHRNSMVSASDDYGKYRWLSDGSISFAEGSYDGVYGRGDDTVSGTVHGRQIAFLKDCGLWIVTDRLSSPDKHFYTQRWRIPVTPTGNSGRSYKAFDPSDIVLDNSVHTLKTQQENSANLSVYSFGTSWIYQWKDTEHVDDGNGYKISDFCVANTGFEAAGDNLLLSVIYPRFEKNADLLSIEEKSGADSSECGFVARLSDGSVVEYMAASGKEGSLKCDNVSADCEALLTVKKGGTIKGMVLACRHMTVAGNEFDSGSSDFEFEITGSDVRCTNVLNTPLGQVEIQPGRNVFTDSIDIELSSPDNDVEIRYTLDGSEPDNTSLLLEQDVRKVRLSETTVVRARAYRKGQTGLDCTSASPITSAVFRKQQPKPATAYDGSQHGLKAEYYEGDWKKAFVSLDLCDPVKKGYVQGLFDLSLKSTDADFAFSYSGYIKVPETGVYTFYAPYEYTHADVMEGYELNLYIDGELWYPATTRHAFGSWSVALDKGCHSIVVEYADCRCGTQEFFNTMGSKKIIWDGDIPNLEFEGPGVERQMIGSEYLFR